MTDHWPKRVASINEIATLLAEDRNEIIYAYIVHRNGLGALYDGGSVRSPYHVPLPALAFDAIDTATQGKLREKGSPVIKIYPYVFTRESHAGVERPNAVLAAIEELATAQAKMFSVITSDLSTIQDQVEAIDHKLMPTLMDVRTDDEKRDEAARDRLRDAGVMGAREGTSGSTNCPTCPDAQIKWHKKPNGGGHLVAGCNGPCAFSIDEHGWGSNAS